MRVAIQGETGSFSHEAALALAPDADLVPCALSAEVFEQLVAGAVDAAVIPIENSLAGSVLEHYDLLLAHPVHIEREQLLRIRHNLIAAEGATLDALCTVFSHPIALAQCRGFFRQHPHLQPASFYDTAGSVKHILSLDGRPESKKWGAIASRQAALRFGGRLLAEGIEDNPENYTRFFLLRAGTPDQASAIPSPDEEQRGKVSLCFMVENRCGSLVDALQVFADEQINLTRIESRPVPGSPWQYIFYADYELQEPSRAEAAVRRLAPHCSMIKELGRYPAAPPLPVSG
ncbi:MAG TPA: prephenate dehydratase domain-containing protein [Acidobacteriaceae bacterium]